MIDEAQRPALGARFGWWWLNIGKALLPLYLESPHGKATKSLAIPKGKKGPFTASNTKPEWWKSVKELPREHQEALCLHWYVEHYSEHAFRYELHGRRGFTSNTSKAEVDYENGKPFHKLTNAQIEMLAIVHNTRQAKKPLAYSVSRPEDIGNPQIIQAMQEQAKLGWTEPMLIHFNLKGCADADILGRIASHLKCERWRLGVPSPHVNTGKKNAACKTGKPFTEIEALDVWTRLPRAEAKSTGYAEKQAREARKAITELSRETNPAGL